MPYPIKLAIKFDVISNSLINSGAFLNDCIRIPRIANIIRWPNNHPNVGPNAFSKCIEKSPRRGDAKSMVAIILPTSQRFLKTRIER